MGHFMPLFTNLQSPLLQNQINNPKPSNRPFSLGGHVESRENKKLSFARLASPTHEFGARLAVQNKVFILRDSPWPLSEKCLLGTGYESEKEGSKWHFITIQSRTQSLQAFWSAGQRREDSGDIEKIQFF